MLYIIGNGGSAAIASHALTDFVNSSKLAAQVLHESALITCMSNDYGYENAYANILNIQMNSNDILIAISSSGRSLNIRNAVTVAIKKKAKVLTFSGFSPDNPLRKMGEINFWINSQDYGYVEIGHQFLLHNLSERIAIAESDLSLSVQQSSELSQ